MDNISVVFATKTEHSRKLAEAIGKEFGVKAKNITESIQPEETGLLFLVGGIYSGKSNHALCPMPKSLTLHLSGRLCL